MSFSTLNEWLEFQQGINPKEIDLSLERVKTVFERLQINIPEKNVFLIGGTNGKGTTTSILEQWFPQNKPEQHPSKHCLFAHKWNPGKSHL